MASLWFILSSHASEHHVVCFRPRWLALPAGLPNAGWTGCRRLRHRRAASLRRRAGRVGWWQSDRNRFVPYLFSTIEVLVLQRTDDAEVRLPTDLLFADANRAGADRRIAAQE